MRTMPKTSARLLSLLSLLQVRRDWPGALLAERLDVSPRTVRRDVGRVRELGYPIVAFKGPDGGYWRDWPCRGEVILDLPAAAVSRHTRDGVVAATRCPGPLPPSELL